MENTATYTDGMGFTEAEWERVWESPDTGRTASFGRDDDDYCEGCDSTVVYDGIHPHGICRCDS